MATSATENGDAPARGSRVPVAAAAMIAACILPFFLVDVPPVLDYPQHLARMYLLAFADADPVLSTMFRTAWRLIPNLAIDIVGPPLLKVFPVHVAGRIVLAGALLLPVAGVLAYHRAVFGRLSGWAVAVGLVAYNGIFLLGFLNFLYGIGLAFLAAAWWIAWRERSAIAGVAGTAFLSAVVFVAHLYATFLLGLLVGTQELARLWRRRRDGTLTAIDVASSAAILLLALSPMLILSLVTPSAVQPGPIIWDSFPRKVFELLVPFMTTSRAVTLATAIGVGVAVVLGWRRGRVDTGSAIAFVILFLVYFAVPGTMTGGAYVATRLPLMFGLVLFAGFRPSFQPREGRVVGLALALVFTVRIAMTAIDWHGYAEDVAEVRKAIAVLNPGDRVIVATAALGASPDYLAAEPPARRLPDTARLDIHLGSLATIERHAFMPLIAADTGYQPLARLPAYDALSKSNGEPADYRWLADPGTPAARVDAPYLAGWEAKFGYVLVLDAEALPTADFLPEKLELIGRAGTAAMYRVKR
ncbi:MAG TPA: hypothetical protein VFB16_05975 [Bauldia sp.]|nr:hypothetical protein [Bauldia sp.]